MNFPPGWMQVFFSIISYSSINFSRKRVVYTSLLNVTTLLPFRRRASYKCVGKSIWLFFSLFSETISKFIRLKVDISYYSRSSMIFMASRLSCSESHHRMKNKLFDSCAFLQEVVRRRILFTYEYVIPTFLSQYSMFYFYMHHNSILYYLYFTCRLLGTHSLYHKNDSEVYSSRRLNLSTALSISISYLRPS